MDYWTQKFKFNNALIAEKQAQIRRLELELIGLQKRKERIGKRWVESRKGQDGTELSARSRC